MTVTPCTLCGSNPLTESLNGLAVFRCPRCRLVWRQTFDLPETYYDQKIMHAEEGKMAQRFSNAKDRIRTFGPYADLHDLCDIGTGDGVFLKALRAQGFRGGVGIEPSTDGRQAAAREGLVVYSGEADDAPRILSGSGVRTITLFHVIEHLPDPIRTLTILREALPAGGVLILETPNIDAYSIRRMHFRHKLIYPEHLFYFSEKTLPRLVRQCGFTVVARGRRDFDPEHLSIGEILFRLGVRSTPSGRALYTSTPRRLIQWAGGHLVRALGRLDYLWLVAQKN